PPPPPAQLMQMDQGSERRLPVRFCHGALEPEVERLVELVQPPPEVAAVMAVEGGQIFGPGRSAERDERAHVGRALEAPPAAPRETIHEGSRQRRSAMELGQLDHQAFATEMPRQRIGGLVFAAASQNDVE